MQLYSKTPSEIRHHTVSIADRLNGQQVSSVAATVNALGLVAGGTALACTAAVTDTGTLLKFEDGPDGEIYRVDLSFTLDNGDLLERSLEVHIIDLDFAVPADGVPVSYLSPRDYMERFDFQELLDLTADRDSDMKTVGKKRFFAALQDATAEINAVLAARFEVPAVNPPKVLKAHAAAIAREILYRFADNMPEHVAEAAKAARRAVNGLATSDLNLPGLSVRSTLVGTPQFESGEAQFTRKNLEGF